jgi:hypothetical protein
MNLNANRDGIEKARMVPIEGELQRRGIKLKRAGKELVGPCPKCGGDDRFAVNVPKQVWHCRSCGVGGDVIKLVEHLDGVAFIDACTMLAGEPLTPSLRKVVVAEFQYDTADGVVAFVVERIEFRRADGSFVLGKDGKRKKSFRQKRPDPNRTGAWLWNVNGVAAVPYKLPQLIEAISNKRMVVIAEGERKADLLWSWNIPATCCAGGAKKWRTEHSEFLRGSDVLLVPDNDDSGWEHVNQVGDALKGIAARVRVLMLPGLPAKGDVIDWQRAGGTREQLEQLIAIAPDWIKPVGDASDEAKAATAQEDALIEALRKLPPGIEFARQRKRAAKELGVNQSAIDDELEARRSENRNKATPLHGHWIVEPWPEPIDGDALLRDIMQRVRRHVVCTHDDALTIALWIMMAWVHDEVATHSPILNITSAEPESGKTTTLGVVSFLLPRCISSVEISEAALFRSIKLWQPSFAIDEFDSVLASDDKTALRSVVNSGHTRGQGVVRCVEPDFKPELFSTFCPKAIGMVGRKLPATTLGRCLLIELRRRKSSEPIERFQHKDDAGLSELRSRLARWAADNEDVLHDAKPSMPAMFDNRRADNWRLPLAIADLAGEDWGDKARLAATMIEGAADVSTIGVRLLSDIKRIFDEDGGEVMLSSVLVAKLIENPEAPWVEWGRGKGLTQNGLATLLGGGSGYGRGSRGGFGIHSQTVHPVGSLHGRGYKRSQFEDVWARYLPSSSPEAVI